VNDRQRTWSVLTAVRLVHKNVSNVKRFRTCRVQHLRAWIDYAKGSHQLYYWRTRSGVEVDFVVYGDGGIWAIEVKNSARVKPEDLRGLKAFQQDYPEAQCALWYRGDEALKVDGIHCVPCEVALRRLHPDRKLF
ncbi:MAG: DUF4143 domain-containing protein, partial [Nitrospira sp.]|nr:DUF4143 domain-containing protein [Nitrospira sp.]